MVAAGIAVGALADRLVTDPARGHPVAGFGAAAAALQRVTYSDRRCAGVGHELLAVGAVAVLGMALQRAARPVGPVAEGAVVAAATWVVLGGESLARTAARLAGLIEAGDVDAARALLPSLCGRDPRALDAAGLVRAALESVAENTSDAYVAPVLYALGGAPAALAYRAVNTLDAMIGYRSPRYARFGWAAARVDDLLNYVPARVTGGLTALCAPLVGGSPAAALRVWRRDARRHPSPNAGVAEAAFAGALGVRLGGPTQYAHQLEIRPTLGDGPAPTVADLRRAVRLARAVQAAAALLVITVAGRSGRRGAARW